METRNKNKIGVWFAKTKEGKLLTFVNEPKRVGDIWTGDFYVNSIIYENILNVLSGSPYSWNDDAQYLEFSLVQP